ncbi:response regulator [Sphingomonas aerophila]|uniref:CheY-like chemotaxis protein n=1 Tax=Sphingomonas aerophila TaxID=1344948 RepID=A0A7W9B9N7_9SPHN|nr:CheY-like chemotaxis protein [Sphingomonas aerophila]
MQTLTGRHVLVVDDESMIRLMLADTLEQNGCLVQEADGGAMALERLAADHAYDLLVTDIRMPEMDGWTLAERARELRPDLAVLYVTGYPGDKTRSVAGAEVLLKPFLGADLIRAATKLMN